MSDETENSQNDLHNFIGKNISRFRRELSLSQAQLAPKLGISQQHLASIEVGVRRASIDMLLQTCDVLHVSITDLLPKQELSKKPGPRPKLAVAYEKLVQLPEKEQNAVVVMIDSLAAASIKE